eukprot:TRINITY_DN7080_c0_g1_i5.p1 TRINITY_DN7080_c0_g1~~TRINITY_DN7080_c0_g1_i5.p1  ORF type:complete len:302 (-),score=57.77 TRINITY_DN7080_c0_g1_i5:1274-2179(-)
MKGPAKERIVSVYTIIDKQPAKKEKVLPKKTDISQESPRNLEYESTGYRKEERPTAHFKNSKQLKDNNFSTSNKPFQKHRDDQLEEYEESQFIKHTKHNNFDDYEPRQDGVPRHTEYEPISEHLTQHNYSQPFNPEFHAEAERNIEDTSFLTNDRELMGISEQVPFNGSQGIFAPGAYPLYPYGMMQAPGFVGPMVYPVQYPGVGYAGQVGEAQEKAAVGNAELKVGELNEEVRKLKEELNEAKAKSTESAIDSTVEGRVRELEEKLKRKEIDTKVTEDVLRSEIDALKKRNEVLLYINKS